MPISEEQLAEMQARLKGNKAKSHGHPLKDALIGVDAFRQAAGGHGETADIAAVGAGQELALHGEIMKECRRRGWVYVYHDASRPTRATMGTPDFIIYAAGGQMLHVECKTRTGKLSKEQENFKRHIEAFDHFYHVVRSIGAFKKLTETMR